MSPSSTLMKQHPKSTQNQTAPNFVQSRKTASKMVERTPNEFQKLQSPTAQSVMQCFEQQASALGSKTSDRRNRSGRPLSTTASTVGRRTGNRSSGTKYSALHHRAQRIFSSKKNIVAGDSDIVNHTNSSAVLMPSVRALNTFKEETTEDEDVPVGLLPPPVVDTTPSSPIQSRDISSDCARQKALSGNLRVETNASWRQSFDVNRVSNSKSIEHLQVAAQTAKKAIQGMDQLVQPSETTEDQLKTGTPITKKRSYNIIVTSARKPDIQQRRRNSFSINKKSNLRLATSQGSQDDLNQSPLPNANFDSSSKLTQRKHVFADVLESYDSKGRVKNLFKSMRWKKDKDALVDSMNHHMKRHRPRVLLTTEQERKRTELAGRFVEGNQLLQRHLSRTFGMTGIKEIEILPEAQQYLQEVPELIENKRQQDEMVQNKRNGKLVKGTGTHMRRTFINTKAFDTLNRSSSMRSSQQVVHSSRNVEPSSSLASLTDQQNLRPQISSVNVSPQKRLNFTEVPIDPKPDVMGMTFDRIDHIRGNLVQKINDKQNQPKTLWRRKQTEKNTGVEELPDTDNELNAPLQPPIGDFNQQSAVNLNTVVTPQSFSVSKSMTRLGSGLALASTNQTLKTEVSAFEAKSPGIGAPVKGKLLKKLSQNILEALDIEIVDTVYEKSLAQLMMPDCERDSQWLNKHFMDMNGSDFWQQKGLLCAKDGKADAAMDYYRQGLRKNPTNEILIYSLALCYLQTQKYDSAIRWFSHGIKLNPRWIDGLCGVAIAYFNMQSFEKSLKYIELAKNNFKGVKNQPPLKDPAPAKFFFSDELPRISKLSLNTITLVQATSMKETGRLDQASNVYLSLEQTFQTERSRDLISLMWGCILVPLSSERRSHADHYRNMQEMLEHISDVPIPAMDHENLLLSRFCKDALKDKQGYTLEKLMFQDFNQPPQSLDIGKYKQSIWTLIRLKSFFKRFNNLTASDDKKLFEEIIERADVELYRKDQPVFLDKRVAIVVMGSIEIRSHSVHNLLKPHVVKKAVEGDIIGSELNEDKNITLSPLTWLMSMQNYTEVLYLSQDDFKKINLLHRRFTEQFFVIHKLNQNKFFQQLNRLTKYHLVFECLDLKKFYPSQLMLSCHKRSPLSPCFSYLYQDCISKFRKEIDSKIMRQQEKHASVYQGFLKALNQPSLADTHTNNNTNETIAQPLQSIRQTTDIGGGQASTMLIEDCMDSGNSQTGGTSPLLATSQLSSQAIAARQATIMSRKKRLSKLIEAKQLAAKEEDVEIQSSSTDYGVEHCHQLMAQKEMQKHSEGLTSPAIDDNEFLVEYDDENECDELGDASDEEESAEVASHLDEAIRSENFTPLGHLEPPLMDLSLERDVCSIDERSRPRSQSPLKKKVMHSTTVSFMSPTDSDFKDVTSFNAQSRQMTQKKPSSQLRSKSFNKQLSLGIVEEMHVDQLIAIEEGSGNSSDGIDNVAKLVPVKKPTNSRFLRQPTAINLTFKDKNNGGIMTLEDLENMSISPAKPPAIIRQVKINYNFLFKRYIEQIEGDHKPTKKELKRRKNQTEHMLKFVTGLNLMLMVQKEITTSEELDQQLKAYSESFKEGKVVFEEDPIPKGSSGFLNTHYIDKMNSSIELIVRSLEQVEEAFDIVLKFLIDEVDSKYARQLDTDGIHFIADGDAFIFGPNGTQNMKLQANDCFGQSDFVKMPGPEFLGNVRAGLTPVQTYYLSVDDLKRRISIPEKLRMYQQAETDDRRDVLIKYMVRRDNIVQGEKLRNY